jgi:hypothetical protein
VAVVAAAGVAVAAGVVAAVCVADVEAAEVDMADAPSTSVIWKVTWNGHPPWPDDPDDPDDPDEEPELEPEVLPSLADCSETEDTPLTRCSATIVAATAD